MYNPNQLDLPDFEDKRLTDYAYSYDCLFIHAVGFRSEQYEETPFIETIFWTPFKVYVPFHFLMWPETQSILESEKIFDVEQINPSRAEFPEIEAQILSLLRMEPNSKHRPSIENWYDQAKEEGFDKVGIVEDRVRYVWTIRAWEGLTLDRLESEMAAVEYPLEFTKDFDVDEESFMIFWTEEPIDLQARPPQLVLASEHDGT
jgi:hypothetical protein